jgi:hypothetical protein
MTRPRDVIDRTKNSPEIVEQKIGEEMRSFFVDKPNSVQWFYAAILSVITLMRIESELHNLLEKSTSEQTLRRNPVVSQVPNGTQRQNHEVSQVAKRTPRQNNKVSQKQNAKDNKP